MTIVSRISFPPRPSVEHLLTVFRRIDAKKILIPAFQRSFVWTESQILDLLESVYSGYPVGSILLWNVEKALLKVSNSDDVPFPKGQAEYPVDFVLDGLQRLSTLYGVFHYGSATHNERFNVGFNLKRKRFDYWSDVENSEDIGLFVPLNSLFNPRALLDVQQRLFQIPKGEELVQLVLTLQSRFQDYMLPLVTLTQRDPSEVVSIFERVNSTGTRLGRVDFMRAITWSSQFDLNDALDDIGGFLKEMDFEIADDTIVKALGLTFNLDPVPDVMLKLRERKASELTTAVRRTKKSFATVVQFLKSDLHILGSDFVPYEGQLLTLFNVFRSSDKVSEAARAYLKRWFFSISASEALQGKPDHFVARLIRRITATIKEDAFSDVEPESQVKMTSNPFDFAGKRMIKGKALSTAFVSLLGMLEARSLIDGRKIPLEEYLRTFDTANFVPILAKDELPPEFGGGVSNKTLANIVLIPPTDAPALKKKSIHNVLVEFYSRSDRAAVCESQLLPNTAADFVRGDYFSFLERRAEKIWDTLTELAL
jgi:hypothetical protein